MTFIVTFEIVPNFGASSACGSARKLFANVVVGGAPGFVGVHTTIYKNMVSFK